MTTTRIGLIRHGETLWNRNGRWQGQAPVPLNEEGEQQAQLLAAYLAAQRDDAAVIYASDLRRALQTAQAIAARLNIPVIPDRLWREIDVGEWQGLTVEEVRAWDPDRLALVTADPQRQPRPGGESWEQVGERGLQAMLALPKAHPDQRALVVTHGGLIRSVLNRLIPQQDPRFIVDNTSVTELTYDHESDVWRLVGLNRLEHLGSRKTVMAEYNE
ncbi:MAG: histidine phosphatase family protein [Anaerolineae bacterium]|nr:histidine phosphatase family protein [Anaerolineae bacterium]